MASNQAEQPEEPIGPQGFSALRIWAAEGARVGLTTCLFCGASILIDPSDDIEPMQLHLEWHGSQARTSEEVQTLAKVFGYPDPLEASKSAGTTEEDA